ncbi:MAG: hypothetical protein R6X28_13520 [Bacteroidales bacterium]
MVTNSNQIKYFETQEISRKLLKQIKRHPFLDEQVIEYNKKHSYFAIENCITFLLENIMVEYKPSIEQIHWKNNVRKKEIIQSVALKEALDIIIEYVNIDSRISMGRFMVNSAPEFKGKDIKYVHTFDYSLIISPAQLESYKSVLFSEKNHDCITTYYLDYIFRFPIELSEFEKIVFYFIMFLTDEIYPINATSGEVLRFVQQINEIVRIRYIDFNKSFIQALLYLFSIDEELLGCSNSIYEDIKLNNEMLRDQIDAMGS